MKHAIKKILTYLRISIYVLLLWFMAHTAYVVYIGTKNPDHHADVAVILGTAVLPNGKLSRGLEVRTQAGLELFQKGLVDQIVVSGGTSLAQHYEGDAMRDYLIAHGVPADKIITDNHGDNTWLTAVNLKALQQEHGFNSVIVVSHYYHIARSSTSLKRVGFTDVQGYSPSSYRDLKALVREFIAFYAYFFIH